MSRISKSGKKKVELFLMNLKIGSSLVTERGSHPYSYNVDGLPEEQEARLLNHGTERQPDWHFSRRLARNGNLIEDKTSYKTADEAFAALRKEFD